MVPHEERVSPKEDIHRTTKIDRAYISNLEAVKQNPTLWSIIKIADVLGVSSSELLK